MATISEILGRKLPENVGEDSYSFLPLLKGSTRNTREQAIYCRWDGLQAIRKGDWKLVCTRVPELYNLKTDLAETKNIAAENPQIVREMLALRKKLIDDGRSTPGKAQQNDGTVKVDFEK